MNDGYTAQGSSESKWGRELLCKAVRAKRLSLSDLLFIANQEEFGAQSISNCASESGFAVLKVESPSWIVNIWVIFSVWHCYGYIFQLWLCPHQGYKNNNKKTPLKSFFRLHNLVRSYGCCERCINTAKTKDCFCCCSASLWLLVMNWVDLCSWLMRIWNVGSELMYLSWDQNMSLHCLLLYFMIHT